MLTRRQAKRSQRFCLASKELQVVSGRLLSKGQQFDGDLFLGFSILGEESLSSCFFAKLPPNFVAIVSYELTYHGSAPADVALAIAEIPNLM
ncbi:hypothetical protein [Phormidesmis priestleyi]